MKNNNLKGIGSILVASAIATTLSGCSMDAATDVHLTYSNAEGDTHTLILKERGFTATGESKTFDSMEHMICLEDIGTSLEEVGSINGYDLSVPYNGKTYLINTEPVIVEEYFSWDEKPSYPYPGVVVKEKDTDKEYILK